MSQIEKVLGIQEKPLVNLSIAELTSKLDTLINECRLKGCDNIEEEIVDMQESIEMEKRDDHDTVVLEASLKKLQEILQIKKILDGKRLQESAPVRTEEEILVEKFRKELQSLKISEENCNQKLVECRKKIKAFTTANKPPADIEQLRDLEKRLLAVLDIRTNLQRLKEQPLVNQAFEKKKSVSSETMVIEVS